MLRSRFKGGSSGSSAFVIFPGKCHKRKLPLVLYVTGSCVRHKLKIKIMKTKILYWTFTLLFALPMTASGIAYIAAAPFVVEGMQHLGYPIYILRFLGIAKLLGVLAIVTGVFPKVKEWAYAGFVFNFSGALYSHLCAGDGPKAIPAAVMLVFGVLSYTYWKKLSADSAQKNVVRGFVADELGARAFARGK